MLVRLLNHMYWLKLERLLRPRLYGHSGFEPGVFAAIAKALSVSLRCFADLSCRDKLGAAPGKLLSSAGPGVSALWVTFARRRLRGQ